MKTRACLLLLVVFTLVWQSDGWWWGSRRRSSSTKNCSGPPFLPSHVTWSDCRGGTGPYRHGHKCSFSCQPGYTRVSGTTTRTCSNGAWKGSRLVCRRAPKPGPSYRKCIGQTRSNARSTLMYDPLSGLKFAAVPVNRDTSCTGHPRSNSAGRAPFFKGTTPLFELRGRRDVDAVPIWTLAHSVLLFRGEIFEWTLESWEGLRCPSDCAITWTKSTAGYSTCTREQAEFFTREYKSNYGSYNLLFNNCHIFANRLMRYLDSGCTRMPR